MNWKLKVGLVLLVVVLLAVGWYGGVSKSADDYCRRTGWDRALLSSSFSLRTRWCAREVDDGLQTCLVDYMVFNGGDCPPFTGGK